MLPERTQQSPVNNGCGEPAAWGVQHAMSGVRRRGWRRQQQQRPGSGDAACMASAFAAAAMFKGTIMSFSMRHVDVAAALGGIGVIEGIEGIFSTSAGLSLAWECCGSIIPQSPQSTHVRQRQTSWPDNSRNGTCNGRRTFSIILYPLPIQSLQLGRAGFLHAENGCCWPKQPLVASNYGSASAGWCLSPFEVGAKVLTAAGASIQ